MAVDALEAGQRNLLKVAREQKGGWMSLQQVVICVMSWRAI